MRIKALFTVEASYIIPVFTVIVVILINMLLFLHDKTIYNSVDIKMNMRAEFEGKETKVYEQAANEYLKGRLIVYDEKINIQKNKLIKDNNMPYFLRFTKAVVSLKEGE